MTTRRDLLVAVGASALVLPLAAIAQRQPAKVARLGFLGVTSAAAYTSWVEALRVGLRDLGYVEGKNIVIEFRWAESKHERLQGLAAELVRLNVDVIVAPTTPAIQAVKKATVTIPIVMVATPDPVGAGLVASLSRPGGNLTGLSNLNVDLSSKYLELLGVAIPKLSRVAVLVNPAHPVHPDYLKRIQTAAKSTNLSVSPVQGGPVSQIESVFGETTRVRAGALIVLPDPFFFMQARPIAELAMRNRVATMFWTRQLAEAGGLMSYGQNLDEHFRRAATYVDKILKGARPGDLPVEQPTKLELVINRRTAMALGLDIPNELLLRADKVIE